jgi:hypothetical protein
MRCHIYYELNGLPQLLKFISAAVVRVPTVFRGILVES